MLIAVCLIVAAYVFCFGMVYIYANASEKLWRTTIFEPVVVWRKRTRRLFWRHVFLLTTLFLIAIGAILHAHDNMAAMTYSKFVEDRRAAIANGFDLYAYEIETQR